MSSTTMPEAASFYLREGRGAPFGPRRGAAGPSAGQPMLNLPPMVSVLLAALLVVHVARALIPEAIDDGIVLAFGFVPARYTGAEPFGWSAIVAPLAYQLLHGGIAHLAANMAMLMAFGSGVERRIGPGPMVALAAICGVLGAAMHLAIYPDSPVPVIGASAAISGLFGAILRFLPGQGGLRRLLPLIALWIGASVLFGLTGLPGAEGAEIAWVAHIGGFAAGLALFGLFDRRRPLVRQS